MSKNQAKKETSTELSTRIASENKAKLDAKRVQQEFDRQERVANRNKGELSNQTGAIMTEEALKAEIAQLKLKVNAQDVDLDKFGVMQTQYFANEKKWKPRRMWSFKSQKERRSIWKHSNTSRSIRRRRFLYQATRSKGIDWA
jgi:hypothetical protein